MVACVCGDRCDWNRGVLCPAGELSGTPATRAALCQTARELLHLFALCACIDLRQSLRTQGCFGIVAQRLARRIRVHALHNILHQVTLHLDAVTLQISVRTLILQANVLPTHNRVILYTKNLSCPRHCAADLLLRRQFCRTLAHGLTTGCMKDLLTALRRRLAGLMPSVTPAVQ